MCLVTSFHCFYATLLFSAFRFFSFAHFLSLSLLVAVKVRRCTRAPFVCVWCVSYHFLWIFLHRSVRVLLCASVCLREWVFFYRWIAPFVSAIKVYRLLFVFFLCVSHWCVASQMYAYVFCFWLPFSKVYLLEGWHSPSFRLVLLLLLLFLVYILTNEIYLLSVLK